MKSILSLALCLAFIATTQAQSQLKPPTESAMDRFLRYVKIDTQSQEDQTTVPSTRKQLNLANLLAKELTTLAAQNVFGQVEGKAVGVVEAKGNVAGQDLTVLGFELGRRVFQED